MRTSVRIAVLLVLIGAVAWAAQPIQVIRLKDDSVIRGRVVELKDNVYRIQTETLGEVAVAADKVLVIANESEVYQPNPAVTGAPRIREGRSPRRGAAPPPPAVPSTPPPGSNLGHQQDVVNNQVQSMMMNQNFLEKMMNFSANPDLEAVMDDPELMEAIQNQDYEKLMNNEKMQKLMESQGTQELLGDFEY